MVCVLTLAAEEVLANVRRNTIFQTRYCTGYAHRKSVSVRSRICLLKHLDVMKDRYGTASFYLHYLTQSAKNMMRQELCWKLYSTIHSNKSSTCSNIDLRKLLMRLIELATDASNGGKETRRE